MEKASLVFGRIDVVQRIMADIIDTISDLKESPEEGLVYSILNDYQVPHSDISNRKDKHIQRKGKH